jgi:polyhydroxyalkanoate synthesis regulator phasin
VRVVTVKAQERLEALVSELRKAAEDQAEQAQQMTQDLMERSRKNSEKLLKAIDNEIRNQLANMGVATKADIRRLEKKIEALSKAQGPAKKAAAKKTTAKKTTAKKARAK